eukprot:TRINITY_DN14179_c0_g2_i2.p1 TRINITY_DN14179_c0_g2~~TRINITY_DN14179_c0_g2_i2.p1  ORF type:complete len:724 (-),score=149.27 TRINITY_DN14179_c0_g2_i2:213-2384(-)
MPRPIAQTVNLYELLSVSPLASLSELKSAFKRRALVLHPDKGGSKEGFQQVLFAFETLSDSTSRAKHDRRLAAATATTTTTAKTSTSSAANQAATSAAAAATAATTTAKTFLKRRFGKGGFTSRSGACPPSAEKDVSKKKNNSNNNSWNTSDNSNGNGSKNNSSKRPFEFESGTYPERNEGSSAAEAQSTNQNDFSRKPAEDQHGGKKRKRNGLYRKRCVYLKGLAERCMSEIFKRLQHLPADNRRSILLKVFTQPQRLALELFAVRYKEAKENNGANHLSSELALRDPSASSDSESGYEDQLMDEESSADAEEDHYCTNYAKRELRALPSDESLYHSRSCNAGRGSGDGSGGSGGRLGGGSGDDGYVDGAAADVKPEHETLQEGQGHDQDLPSVGRKARVPTLMRGIVSNFKANKRKTYYRAQGSAKCIGLYSRWSVDLAVALDYLLVITALAQKIKEINLKEISVEDFDSSLNAVLSKALAEHNLDGEIGFYYNIRVTLKWWWLPRNFSCPAVRTFDRLISAWRQLYSASSHSYLRVSVPERWHRLKHFEEEWKDFCKSFLAVVNDNCRKDSHLVCERWAERLKKVKDDSEVLRERAAMEAEELWSKQLAEAVIRDERLRNAQALAQEIKEQREARRREHYEAQIRRALQHWQKCQDRLKKIQQKLRHQRAVAQSLRKAQQLKKAQQQVLAQKAQMRKKWYERRRNHKDPTMDELLHSSAP